MTTLAWNLKAWFGLPRENEIGNDIASEQVPNLAKLPDFLQVQENAAQSDPS